MNYRNERSITIDEDGVIYQEDELKTLNYSIKEKKKLYLQKNNTIYITNVIIITIYGKQGTLF